MALRYSSKCLRLWQPWKTSSVTRHLFAGEQWHRQLLEAPEPGAALLEFSSIAALTVGSQYTFSTVTRGEARVPGEPNIENNWVVWNEEYSPETRYWKVTITHQLTEDTEGPDMLLIGPETWNLFRGENANRLVEVASGEMKQHMRVRTSAGANSNPCPPQESRQQSGGRKDLKDACSHPDMSVQNCTDSQIKLSLILAGIN